MSARKPIVPCDKGIAAVEFAALAPVMLLLVGGLLELGYVTFARSTLESAILEASRASRVSDCPAQNAELIQTSLNNRMKSVISSDGKDPVLKVFSYGTEFGNVGNPEPFNDIDGNGVFDPGEPYTDINGNSQWDKDMGSSGNYGDFGEVVQFSATFNVKSLMPFISSQINDGSSFYTISASTVVRNEPYKDVTCT